ncbi:MAG TPA: hypothetical protein VFG68_01750 [Fimbriiglobus sp.]|nr:hypothetical protein [Fimbriiglobus sp.]
MRREDVIEAVQKLTADDRCRIMLVLRNGIGINVEVLFRTEPEYLVIRGREAGTTDEHRAFFLPYEEIAYLKLDRSVKTADLQRMFGVPTDGSEVPAAEPATMTPAPVGNAPAPAVDPAVIARQNLLERLRAARTSAGTGPRGR